MLVGAGAVVCEGEGFGMFKAWFGQRETPPDPELSFISSSHATTIAIGHAHPHALDLLLSIAIGHARHQHAWDLLVISRLAEPKHTG